MKDLAISTWQAFKELDDMVDGMNLKEVSLHPL
jgi:hypothetical protein